MARKSAAVTGEPAGAVYSSIEVSRIDMEEGELTVDFDGREVTYGSGELDELVLAYATTIHKSQGSEYPAVVIPLSTQHYPMLQRNLVYTGVTRGKRLVVLVGQRKALAIAVKGARTRRRWSKLREWLTGGDTPSAAVSDAPNRGLSKKRAGS
jgi:exodeoxyribonuclease V alpha subunit